MIKDKIVCYVDVAKNKEFTKKYEVRNIPDSRIFKKGKMVKKLVGYSGKKAYQEFIDK
jgi:thioredoxin-like negative regulator of GroEL